jgi:hypothetical protein
LIEKKERLSGTHIYTYIISRSFLMMRASHFVPENEKRSENAYTHTHTHTHTQ